MATTQTKDVHVAKARSTSLPISTKHSIEISKYLRYKSVAWAIAELEAVVAMETAVPFTRFNKDMGHKAGMSAGRYPVKAASHFLRLVKSARANAEDLGLDAENLKISKIVANKASNPFTGRRMRGSSKRTHIEIEVKEMAAKPAAKKSTSKKSTSKAKAAPAKETAKAAAPTKAAEEKAGESQ